MQLGMRWRAGDPPHSSVPAELFQEIAAQELRFPEASAWTLTWLEGRPRCDLDGVVVVRLTADGTVLASSPDADFDIVGYSVDSAGKNSEIDRYADEDDDDWLK